MSSVLAQYSAIKSGLSTSLGVTEDLLHLHAGLLIFFFSALVLQRRLRSRLPIGLVWFFALGNEVVDVMAAGSGEMRLEPIVDILNTVFWPTMLFILARRRQHEADPDRTL